MTYRSETAFPEGFRWGSATAALQIEGAAAEDGRTPSVWDQFCENHPEKIFESATPAVACDHYHRLAEDVRWMKDLGHNAYRFSLSWPRIVPGGRGSSNPKGLDFYDRLIDGLLENGIEPNVTLYHWDLPLELAQSGGWENPATVDAFLDYADRCLQRWGDRVPLWSTINEPAWTVLNGYITGLHPPGKSDRRAALLAAHHLLCAHTMVAATRPVGIALNLSPVSPATERAEDVQAAELADEVLNGWFLSAVLDGTYPQKLLELYQSRDLAPQSPHRLQHAPPAFLGVNYYYPQHARAEARRDSFHINNSGNPDDDCKFALRGCFEMVRNPRGRYTDWAWEIHPETLTTLLLGIGRRAPGIPMYVTENGIGLPDRLEEGMVNDPGRIEFVREHLQAIHKAIRQGADVRGYYMWSLMDNFSWINGYKKRYGFLYVDRETMHRTPKQSAFWFKEVARRNALD
ncbi:MAG: beta-glucosidase [Candidatus Eremiobacteraeota bacterium]|nr:beta-glucosidase [Candidatus Eremiobacteraeota bacterium]